MSFVVVQQGWTLSNADPLPKRLRLFLEIRQKLANARRGQMFFFRQSTQRTHETALPFACPGDPRNDPLSCPGWF